MIHPKLESWIALLKCEINLLYLKAFTKIPMIFKLLFTAQDRKEYEWGGEKVRCPNRMSIIQNMFLFLPKCPYWLDNIYHKLHTTRHNKGCNCKRSGSFLLLLIQYKTVHKLTAFTTQIFSWKKRWSWNASFRLPEELLWVLRGKNTLHGDWLLL